MKYIVADLNNIQLTADDGDIIIFKIDNNVDQYTEACFVKIKSNNEMCLIATTIDLKSAINFAKRYIKRDH